MMRTKWMVREQTVAGSIFYQVYRIAGDNIQTYGGLWSKKSEADNLCGKMNDVEGGFGDEVLP